MLRAQDVVEDQVLVARLVHAFQADDTDTQYQVLQVARKHLVGGGASRLRHTLPALGFCQLKAIARVARQGSTSSKIGLDLWFRALHDSATALAEAAQAAGPALGLFLEGAAAASEQAGLEIVAYEFTEQAFLLYEESMPDSKQEVRALHSIIGTLQRCRVFGADNRAALAHKCSGYCAKLLRRPDQCRAVLSSSHLHWQQQGDEQDAAEAGAQALFASAAAARQPAVHDEAAVMAALRRALKLASAAQQQLAVSTRGSAGGDAAGPAYLYVDILNSYLYYFDRGLDPITPAVLQSLLELVAGEVGSEAGACDAELQAYYQATLGHVATQRAAGGGAADRYAQVELPKA